MRRALRKVGWRLGSQGWIINVIHHDDIDSFSSGVSSPTLFPSLLKVF